MVPPGQLHRSRRLGVEWAILVIVLLLSSMLSLAVYVKGMVDGWYLATEGVAEIRVLPQENGTPDWLSTYEELVKDVNAFQNQKPEDRRWDIRTIEWFALQLMIAAEKSGLDPRLILSVAKAESSLEFNAVSHRGAVGIMQVLPTTGKELGYNVYDPQQNIEAGAVYLARLLRRYKGNLQLALGAYNAGASRVKNTLPRIRETQQYVKRVIRYYNSRSY